MAHVHCVIVGFSQINNDNKIIVNDDKTIEKAKNINGYLVDAPNLFVESRNKPICNVPEMSFGNMPNDGGNLIIEAEEYDDFIRKEPKSKEYIRQFIGADEFINNKMRYCLWLKDVNPLELTKMPLVTKRIAKVKKTREASKRPGTVKKAETPMLFGEVRQPDTDYLLIPSTTSERRKYIPIGFIDKNVIASNANLIIPQATLYEFGILTSIVHNAWMRAVCGRLKSDPRYSKEIVYNNFPWPAVDDGGRCRDAINRVSTNAQKILDVREKYLKQGASLADLYGDNFDLAFTDLRDAHKELDIEVLKLYGLKATASETDMVTRLFEMFNEQISK